MLRDIFLLSCVLVELRANPTKEPRKTMVESPGIDFPHVEKTLLRCYHCVNEPTHEKCNARGMIQCDESQDSCQTEVRMMHIGASLAPRITKGCKQTRACNNNYIQNDRPGWPLTQCNQMEDFPLRVCRYCCGEAGCNSNTGEPHCQKLEAPRNGWIECATSPGVTSSVCKFGCDECFVIKGSETRTCKSDRYWSGSKTECIYDANCGLEKCDIEMTRPVANGLVLCSRSNNVESVCEFSCDEGSRLLGTKRIECVDGRGWNAEKPICKKELHCQKLESPKNGWIECAILPAVTSTVCKFGCNECFVMKGSETRTCGSDEFWSGSKTECIDDANCGLEKCDIEMTQPVANGLVMCSQNNNVESICEFSCNEGSRLLGTKRIKCIGGRGWNANKPMCKKETQCKKLEAPKNGWIECSTLPAVTSSVCTFGCDECFVIKGSETRNCKFDGYWSGNETDCIYDANCTFEDCDIEMTLPVVNGHVLCSANNSVESICEFSCDEGNHLLGTKRIECIGGRGWDAKKPMCKKAKTKKNPCHELAVFEFDRDGTLTCKCRLGFRGDGVTNCDDIDESVTPELRKCHEHATVTNTIGSYTCACNKGFFGDGIECSDVNECVTGEHDCDVDNGICKNNAGSFSCICAPEYTGDGRRCKKNQVECPKDRLIDGLYCLRKNIAQSTTTRRPASVTTTTSTSFQDSTTFSRITTATLPNAEPTASVSDTTTTNALGTSATTTTNATPAKTASTKPAATPSGPITTKAPTKQLTNNTFITTTTNAPSAKSTTTISTTSVATAPSTKPATTIPSTTSTIQTHGKLPTTILPVIKPIAPSEKPSTTTLLNIATITTKRTSTKSPEATTKQAEDTTKRVESAPAPTSLPTISTTLGLSSTIKAKTPSQSTSAPTSEAATTLDDIDWCVSFETGVPPVMKNESIYNQINDILQDRVVPGDQTTVILGPWIGLDDRYDDTTLRWRDGTQLKKGDFDKWAPGEPKIRENNDFQSCVHLISDPLSYGTRNFLWKVISCSDSLRYSCDTERTTDEGKKLQICQPRIGGIEHGAVSCSDGWNVNSVCTFDCEDGYLIKEAYNQITCMGSSLTWNLPPPICIRAVCNPPLSVPTEGNMTCSNGNRIGSRCEYGCNRGYRVRGDDKLTCLETKEWSSSRPCCRDDCPPFARMNLIFALDSSSSVGQENFSQIKQFVLDLRKRFTVSRDFTHVSAIAFHSEVVPLNNNQMFDSDSEFDKAIDNLPFEGVGTFTGKAIDHVTANFIGRRTGAQDVVVLLTDGKALDDVTEPSMKLKQRNAHVIAVGVKNAKWPELQIIASKPVSDNVVQVDSFEDLSKIVRVIKDRVCTFIC